MGTPNFQMPDKIQLDESSYTDSFGRFSLQPLEKGFGVTIGNAFRRLLLSSLPGFAFTSVHIRGVQHEFSTIPGVVEDLVDIILNLKSVRMKLVDKKISNVELQLSGPKHITAADFQKANPGIEILNPDLHIATLNAGAEIDMELNIGKGRGYVSAEENKRSDQPMGTISIDSIFTPIKNVRYFIEQTRVGQQTDYEKLILEVETDGSITPDDALVQSAKILNDHINLFLAFQFRGESAEELKEKDAEHARIKKILTTGIDDLELSVRSHNCLRAANIKTIADLVRKDEGELLKFRNFGRKSLAELTELVEQNNLTFGMDVDKYLKDIIK
ncbi:MAG: DNA-directed RNA polymerase subunit alpha [Ignavibacteriales bacterium]|nr:DNA-directed RNA polymerase subunit alpha [Ignavibacteriales bacterium]